ncbi:hypothetical protein AN216_13425 [Streptomyces oceani]|uniref:Uncharacterized protein n=1 Tax=Streptomyces oceani TaxID=1075402 RepID=A0A1E7KGN9_9ACTN|nr:hypothetical protein AN216_13425 [Streptomyces oceani]
MTRQEPGRVWPSPSPAGLPTVYAAVAYADEARAVLLAHKERGALRLAVPLGGLLVRAIRASGRSVAIPDRGSPLLLVPLPSARRAVARRGHDATRRIARVAAAGLRREGVSARVFPVLRQRRVVEDQSGLSAGQRAWNLRGALEVVPGASGLFRGARVVIVDDLMTTGASLVEAARAVSTVSDGPPAAAVVAARSRRRGSGRSGGRVHETARDGAPVKALE